MLRDLSQTCGGDGCSNALSDPLIVYETPAGERRAYECCCGAVTITVAK
ncbi:hypothetical protein [Halovenus carboxidivorans]|nr:hypothetical protein [Halovenus carboxidivorans]